MSIGTYLSSSFFKDFHRWPLWLPVFLGIGISIYFSLPKEPSLWLGYAGFVAFGVVIPFMRLQPLRLLFFAVGLIFFGFSIAFFRTEFLKTEMLQYPFPPLLLEGKVSQVELKPTLKGGFYQRLILRNITAKTP